jgi:excinuclease ABC subunit C
MTIIDQKFLQKISSGSGVYQMFAKDDKIIYVGKAVDLKKRLASYMRADKSRGNKTAVMMTKVVRIETIITHSEKEALILEASLIKEFKPRYNIVLRDDKNYPMLKVTVRDIWPRLMMTRKKTRDGSIYFGPFSSTTAMWDTLNFLDKLFPLRRCKGKKIKKRKRPCLNYQMKRCFAPCSNLIDRKEYQEMVEQVVLFLNGKNNQLIKKLESKMKTSADKLDFEGAAEYRDQLLSLRETLAKQIIVARQSRDQDIFGWFRKEFSVAVSIIKVRQGIISGQHTFFLPEPIGLDSEVLAEVVGRFYETGWPVPKEILVPFKPSQVEFLAEVLNKEGEKNKTIRFLVPRSGEKKALLQMAETNANQLFLDKERQDKSWQVMEKAIQKVLNLEQEPRAIECLDISNFAGSQAVGSLVCFFKGEKEKSRYRHYRIKTVHGPDDYGMMSEVLQRRFKKENCKNDLPGLLLVDGGKGQLNIAVNIISELGLSSRVELAGIAKKKGDGCEKLYRPGRKNPIILPLHSPVLLLLMRIRDESHRFGITHHRKLRDKKNFTSELEQIPGVGKNRKNCLLRYFGSLKRIKNASLTELNRVEGIGEELAENIYKYFHG